MKTNRSLLILLLTLACLLRPFMAFAGNEGANAGDEVGLEFQASYYGAFSDIESNFLDLHAKIVPTKAFEIADRVQIVTVNEPLQVQIGDRFQESVATNDLQKNLILINRTRWNAIKSHEVRKSLALHEILSMAGLESSALYPISSVYLSRMMNRQTNK